MRSDPAPDVVAQMADMGMAVADDSALSIGIRERATKYSAPDYRHDIGAWAHGRLAVDLWSLQQDIGNDRNPRVYVRSCHDSGKTFLAAVKACHHLDTHPVGQARVISTAPSNDQVKGLLWNEINQLFERAAALGSPLPGRVIQQEWWIGSFQAGVGRKPSDYKGVNFQGYHCLYPLVIADEADGLTADIWNALETLMTNDNARLFAIGNPDDPTSYFRSLQESAIDLGQKVYRIRAQDTPNFSGEEVSAYVRGVLLGKNWVNDRLRMWGGPEAWAHYTQTGDLWGAPVDHPFWDSKVLAEYPSESNLTIVRTADVERCRHPEKDEADISIPFGVHVIGVDVAGSEKGDETVVRERVGRHALRRWGLRSADPEEIESFIADCAVQAGATSIVIDSTGIGFGFVGALRRRMRNVAVTAFNFGAGANDKEHFLNARAELYWNMRILSRDGGWDLSLMENADDTLGQLTSVRRAEDTKRIQVESKEDLRKRIGRSPDDADALGLAFWQSSAAGTGHITGPGVATIPTGISSVLRSPAFGSGGLPTGAGSITRGAI